MIRMPPKVINIGILGAAKIAPKAIIWPAQDRDECQVLAVASRNLEKAQDFAKTHNIPVALSSYDALINHPDIDLFYNALPPNRHADLTIAALEQGKSVLCEKPFAMNAREAEAMIATAEHSEGHLIEAFHYRFHPAVLKFLDLVHSGTIGLITSIDGVFNVSIPNKDGELRYLPELGGGAMMDLGCYVLHLMRLVTRAEPVIQSANAILSDSGVDVAMQAELRFEKTKATLHCDMREGSERLIEFTVQGEKGRLIFEQYVHPYRGFKITTKLEDSEQSLTHEAELELYNRSTYAYQLDHMMDVLNGKIQPLTGGLDALQTMQSMDAIYRAAGFTR